MKCFITDYWEDINFLIIHTDGLSFEVPLHRTCSDCAFLNTRSRHVSLRKLNGITGIPYNIHLNMAKIGSFMKVTVSMLDRSNLKKQFVFFFTLHWLIRYRITIYSQWKILYKNALAEKNENNIQKKMKKLYYNVQNDCYVKITENLLNAYRGSCTKNRITKYSQQHDRHSRLKFWG